MAAGLESDLQFLSICNSFQAFFLLLVIIDTGYVSNISFFDLVGGKIVLFDRRMLRNFRKDGHNWKKKNDGKTVKEAHEHLKVRNIQFLCCTYIA